MITKRRRNSDGNVKGVALTPVSINFGSLKPILVMVVLAFSSTAASTETAGDLAAAAEDFQTHCAPCHGAGARGDGPAGAALKTPPADLTRIAHRHGGTFPRLSIFETIEGLDMPAAHGTRDMPIWGDVFIGEAVGTSVSIDVAKMAAAKVEQRINGLVKYLESIQNTQ